MKSLEYKQNIEEINSNNIDKLNKQEQHFQQIIFSKEQELNDINLDYSGIKYKSDNILERNQILEQEHIDQQNLSYKNNIESGKTILQLEDTINFQLNELNETKRK
jgi:hypothetical protein